MDVCINDSTCVEGWTNRWAGREIYVYIEMDG